MIFHTMMCCVVHTCALAALGRSSTLLMERLWEKLALRPGRCRAEVWRTGAEGRRAIASCVTLRAGAELECARAESSVCATAAAAFPAQHTRARWYVWWGVERARPDVPSVCKARAHHRRRSREGGGFDWRCCWREGHESVSAGHAAIGQQVGILVGARHIGLKKGLNKECSCRGCTAHPPTQGARVARSFAGSKALTTACSGAD